MTVQSLPRVNKPISTLMKIIGYAFVDEGKLLLALSHRSFAFQNNERLEFLGDSLLNFFIAQALFRQFPKANEGQLSRLRASLVKGKTLAEIALEWELGQYLRLGSGELKSGGFRRESILADAVEAIIGAIYLDCGDLHQCQAIVEQWYLPRLADLSLDDNQKDSKTQLQEYLQSVKQELPIYTVLKTEGMAHEQTFTVSCKVASLEEPVVAEGSSRRMAEQDVAKQVLKTLNVKKKAGI